MSGHLLELDNISISFEKEPILKNVSLVLDEGDCIAITGPNGSGKTTLLRLLSGLIEPVEGKILLSETDITYYPPWKRVRMGMLHVLEGARLFSSLTVQENIAIVLNNNRSQHVGDLDQLRSLAPFLSEPSFLKRSASTLSGGERMMVAIVRAALQKPRIMLLDSPFMGSGPSFRKQVEKTINTLIREENMAVVLVDHDIHSIRKLTRSIFHIVDQQIILHSV
jgi:branched-chain amino acid transport system ATP-binding protein